MINQLHGWRLFLSAFFLLACSNHSQAQMDVYDSFETTGLNSIWSAARMEPKSFEIQSKIVHTGKGAAKIKLSAGDIAAPGNGNDLPTERDELLETDSLESIEGGKYEYQFSMFLPESFPIVPVRLVIAQWKQDCSANAPCAKYSPVLAIRYVSGKLFVTLQIDSLRKTLYEHNGEIRNRWLAFKFRARFSRQNDGEVKAFLNEKEIVNYKGITSYPDGHPNPAKKNRYYFKMGLYRDRMPEPMSIYIDEYRKKEIRE